MAAVHAAPRNAALRYAVAAQYLLKGKKKEALEHASALAGMDDSYMLPDSINKTLTMERQPPEYRAFLSRSFLFKAFEIAWRASDKDISLVKTMVPSNDDAQEVLRLFLEMKGVETERS